MPEVPQLRSSLRKWCPPWYQPRPQDEALPSAERKDHAYRQSYAKGVFVDGTLEAVFESVLLRFPTLADPTALPYLGRSKRILRGLTETDEAFAKRLLRWLEAWRHAGSAYELMNQLRGFLFPLTPRMHVINARGIWWTTEEDGSQSRTVAPTHWNWDDDAEFWDRFWVVIYSPLGNPQSPWARAGTWGDGSRVWGGGVGTTGSNASRSEVQSVRAIIRDWKNADAVCQNIIISFDDTAFQPTNTEPPNPDGLWRYYSKNVAGTQVKARDPRGLYWQGVS